MRIKRILWRPVRWVVLKWKHKSRYIVEKKIFPSIKNKKVLLVGCSYPVKSYPKKLRKNQVFSIEKNPERAEFGAKKHIIGNVAEIDKHFEEDFFDVIFLGSVFGYGLNEPKEAEKVMKNLYKVLKKGGVLIIWWSDMPGHNQVVPEKLTNYKLFTPISLVGIGGGYKTKGNTVFDFLLKNGRPNHHA